MLCTLSRTSSSDDSSWEKKMSFSWWIYSVFSVCHAINCYICENEQSNDMCSGELDLQPCEEGMDTCQTIVSYSGQHFMTPDSPIWLKISTMWFPSEPKTWKFLTVGHSDYVHSLFLDWSRFLKGFIQWSPRPNKQRLRARKLSIHPALSFSFCQRLENWKLEISPPQFHLFANPSKLNACCTLYISEVSEKLAITKSCTKNVSCELQVNATMDDMPCDQSHNSWVCTNCCHEDACNYDGALQLNGFHWIPIIFATFSVLIVSVKLWLDFASETGTAAKETVRVMRLFSRNILSTYTLKNAVALQVAMAQNRSCTRGFSLYGHPCRCNLSSLQKNAVNVQRNARGCNRGLNGRSSHPVSKMVETLLFLTNTKCTRSSNTDSVHLA